MSQKILDEYDLCDNCLGRLFSKKLRLKSNKSLGKKIRNQFYTQNKKCYICKNIFDCLENYIQKILVDSSDYAFKTFLIGAKLKPSFLDRDDQIRSQFKIRGIDGVKTNITKVLTKQFAHKTKAKYRQVDPDITITVDFKTESCTVRSKSVFLSGRYIKNDRNLPQKQKPCDNCMGKGCVTCKNHGIIEFNSVEGMISKYLFDKFGAVQVKITWIGGEDSVSLVLGTGRPFFAKLINPKKRNIKLAKKIQADKIILRSLKQINRSTLGPIHFISQVKMLVVTQNKIQKQNLKNLEQLKNKIITIYNDSGKKTEKLIHSIHYEVVSENSFHVMISVDGGVPLKRFVSGENVFPNISEIIQNKSQCKTFDFANVSISH